MSTYIFIFEDGTVNVSHHPPTPIDLVCIADGTLQVLVADIMNVGLITEDDKVDELPTCPLTGKKSERYHIPAEKE